MMDPWYSGRMPEDTVTLARALKTNGYTTGHAGKWHIAINHNAYPHPKDHGFDVTSSGRGVNTKMNPHRLTGFATQEANDPYRLDDRGFPKDSVTVEAINFMEASKAPSFSLMVM